MTSLIGPLLVPFTITQAKRSADIHQVLGLHVYSKLYQSYHDTANEKKIQSRTRTPIRLLSDAGS